MSGKRVNLITVTLLNVFIVSSVSTSPTVNSNANVGFQYPNERVSDGDMPLPLPVTMFDQANVDQPQETLRAEDEYVSR